MKVLVDARMIGPHGHGIARYVRSIARAQQAWRANPEQFPGSEWVELVFLTDARFPQEGWPQTSARSKFLSPREWWEIPQKIREIGATHYHSPSFASLPSCPVPVLQTVHDLNHLQFGGIFDRLYYEVLLAPFARAARGLWTVSEFSQRELADFLGRPLSEISVLYNAVEPEPAPTPHRRAAVLNDLGLIDGKFLLCLGNPKPHKNTKMLRAAHAAAGISDQLPLVVADRLAEDQVRVLIHACRALLSPSLYEGFGLPPLEAALLGKEVLVSDIPPHREVLACASGVQFLSPLSSGAWVNAMRRLAAFPPHPVEVTQNPFTQARFNQQLLKLYLAAGVG